MSDIRDRISKLLAMANDTRGNEHENETAMRMAEKLMRQHNIDVADLEASSGKPATYTWRTITVAIGEKAARATWRPMWISFVSYGVGKFADCQTVWGQDSEFGHVIQFKGDETDLEYAAWLFKKLRDFGYAESKAVPYKQRDAFLKAYALRLQDRMNQLRTERDAAMKAAVTASGTALMVVNNKLALRDAEFGRQKTSHTRVKYGSQGFHEGRKAADRANFNRPLGGSTQTRLGQA
jgi:Protein of unknown function (DUF2786)